MEPFVNDEEVHEPESAYEEYQLRNEFTEEIYHIFEVDWIGSFHQDTEKHMDNTN